MMVLDPRMPQRIYAAIEQGALLKTEDGGDSWTRIADEVGCVTKGNHAAALRGEIRPRAAAAATH